jgi:hypothetical protein
VPQRHLADKLAIYIHLTHPTLGFSSLFHILNRVHFLDHFSLHTRGGHLFFFFQR